MRRTKMPNNTILGAYVRKEYGWAYKFHGEKATNALCVNNVAQCLDSIFSQCDDGFEGDLCAAINAHIDWFEVASKLVDEHVPMKLNF
jgi:hypothetical protein